jgi:hypothetical protein
MITHIFSEIPTFLAKTKSGKNFHKSPEFFI